MLTETFDQNINNKDAKISSETLEGKGTGNHFDSNPEVFDGSKGSMDSEGLLYIATGGKRENPEILGSDINNKHVNISSETLDGEGTSSHFDSNLDVFDGSESSMDSEGLIEITTGDIRENQDILGSDVNDEHVKISSEGLVDTTNGGERENPDILGSDINNKHVNISSETLDGEETSDHSDSNSLVSDSSKSSMDSEGLIYITTGGKRENPEILGSHNNNYSNSDINETKSLLVPAEVSSSSSSESSSSNFIHVRKVKFVEFSVSKSASKDEQSDVSHESSVKSEASNSFFIPTSTSQVYNSTHGHMGMSPTVSPPIQVMDRSSEYDPHRIPSSVLASKGNSVDWSINSSDSLFSIQLGNPSLSRDLVYMPYESGKSMEFINSGELIKSGESIKSGELNTFGPVPLGVIEDRDTGRKSVKMEDLETTEVLDKDFKSEQRLSKKKNEEKDSHSSETSNVASHSHGNGTDANSSALPIKKKCTWPSCYCSNCSTAFCYYKLPSCYYSCPSCCCSYEGCCSHSSPVLTEVEIVSSIQTDSPQQQSSNISSEVTSGSTSNCCNWYQCQCFSWSCCTWFTCCSQTDSAQLQSSNESSEVNSSSISNCCNWCQCQCFSCSCFSWSCFTWFTCCSQTGSPLQQPCDKDSGETSSSTTSCCSWFQCCSWSCCFRGKCHCCC